MLAQLQNMLENLRNARAMGQNAETAQQMMQMMRELQEMTERQRGLLDRTFRDAQQGRMPGQRSEEHTSELQSLMRISYAVFCLKKKTKATTQMIQHCH